MVYVEGVRGIRQANGTFMVTGADDDTFDLQNTDGADEPFDPDNGYEGGGFWRLLQIPDQLSGSIRSLPFSLGGYAPEDKPVLYFNYGMSLTATDQFRVSVIANGGPAEVIVDQNDLTNLDTTCGDDFPEACLRDLWRQARVELDDYAGITDLVLLFEYDLGPSEFEGVIIDDIVIGFAERGEIVSGATNNPFFEINPNAPPDEVLVGAYQLEIRPGSAYGHSQRVTPTTPFINSLELTRTFDTNDRFGERFAIVAPENPVDGQTFHDRGWNRNGHVSNLTTTGPSPAGTHRCPSTRRRTPSRWRPAFATRSMIPTSRPSWKSPPRFRTEPYRAR